MLLFVDHTGVRICDRLVLSLWDERGFEAEVGRVRRGPGLAPVTLAHNLPTRAAVDQVLAEARAAGATEVSEGVDRDWGGLDRLDHVHAMTEVLPQDDRVDVARAGVVGRS